MEIVPLLPQLHLVKPVFGQTYLWRDGSELTLVDTGVPGSAGDFERAFAELGYRQADLRRVIITHWHGDHAGAVLDFEDTEGSNGLLLGPFNTDRELAKRSCEKLARTPAKLVCFGHGDPVTEWRGPIPDLLG